MRKLNFVKALLIAVIALLGGKTVAADNIYTFILYSQGKLTDNNGTTWKTTGTVGSSNQLASDITSTGTNNRGISYTSNGTLTSDFDFTDVSSIELDYSSNATGNKIVSVKVGTTTFTPENVSIANSNHQKTTFKSTTPASGKLSISLTRSSKTIWIGGMTITSSTSSKTPAGIAYETTSYTVNVDDNFDTPDLYNPNNLTPTYSIKCNPEGVATIDEKTGEVTLAGIEGTATVTATTAETETYAKGIATYTIKVVDADIMYKKVSSTKDLVVGGIYVIVNEGKGVALGLINSDNFGTKVDVTCTDGVATFTTENSITNPYEFELGGTTDAYTLTSLQATIGAQGSSKTNFSTTSNQSWKISFTDQGNADIVNSAFDRGIRYNDDTGDFRLYANNSGALKVQLYKKEGNDFKIGDDKFATFYSADAYIMPEGVTGGIITAADTQSGKLTINYTYTAGTTVPAKTALLLKGEPKTYYYEKTTSSADAPAENLLHGADAVDAQGKTFVDGTNVKYYILSHSTDATKKLGFYWAAANGAAISYQEPYAFLAIDAAGSAPIMLSIDGDDDTTAINGITNDTITDNTMYNLAGQRVNANAKGIIIINGKKVIKR